MCDICCGVFLNKAGDALEQKKVSWDEAEE